MSSRLRFETAITTFDRKSRIWRGKQAEPIFKETDAVGSVVLKSLLKNPGHVSQICYPSGKQYTSQEIATLSVRVAINLQKLKLQQCDVIGLCAVNSDFVAPLTFGALLCGLFISTLDPSFDTEGIRHTFSITRPKIMFCDGNIYHKIEKALKECNLPSIPIYTVTNHIENIPQLTELMIAHSGTTGNKFNAPTLKYGWNQVAMILCSSGTTGMPKAVTMSHACLLNAFNIELDSTDKFLCFSTLYWLTGVFTLIHGTIKGATRIISNRPYTSEDFFDIVERFKVNIILSPPSQIALTLASERINKCDLSSIEVYLAGGSPVPYTLVEKFKKFASNAVFTTGYGMSEVCVFVSYHEVESVNSVGQLAKNIEVKIIDDEGNSLVENQNGEICIRTPFPWAGYFNDPNATAKINGKDGWIHSGDVGHFDDGGCLYIEDRKKDILKYNNFNFYPGKIEKVLMELPDVIDACVVGIPDITYTHLPAVAVVVRPNSTLTKDNIYNYIADKVEHFEHLYGGIYFLDSLPRTVSGKTVRRKVAEICEHLYNEMKVK